MVFVVLAGLGAADQIDHMPRRPVVHFGSEQDVPKELAGRRLLSNAPVRPRGIALKVRMVSSCANIIVLCELTISILLRHAPAPSFSLAQRSSGLDAVSGSSARFLFVPPRINGKIFV
jgi:hypothetical protein